MSVQSALDYIVQLKKEPHNVLMLIDPEKKETLTFNSNGTIEGDKRGYTVMCNHFYIILTKLIVHLKDLDQPANTGTNIESSGLSQDSAPNESPTS